MPIVTHGEFLRDKVQSRAEWSQAPMHGLFGARVHRQTGSCIVKWSVHIQKAVNLELLYVFDVYDNSRRRQIDEAVPSFMAVQKIGT